MDDAHSMAARPRTDWFQAFRLGYRPELDGVRALAVIAVMVHHLYIPMAFFAGLWVGVDLFFVLSGFLITTLLLQEWQQFGKIDLPRFYARRALRLLPALYLVLIVVTIGAILLGGPQLQDHLQRAVPAAFFYVFNWPRAFGWLGNGPITVMWTLAVEDQFYLVWPPVLVVLLRRGMNLPRIGAWLVFGAIGLTLWRGVLWSEGVTVQRIGFGTDVAAPPILLGCFLAVALALGWIRKGRLLNLAGCVALTVLVPLWLLMPYWTDFTNYVGKLIVELAAMVLIALLVISPPNWMSRALTTPLLQWIGRLSYGFYLWHYVIYYATGALVDPPSIHETGPWLVLTAIRFVVTTFVVAISYYAVERPFLRMKHRFAAASERSRRESLVANDAPLAAI